MSVRKCEYTQTWHYKSKWLCHVTHPIHEMASVPQTLFAIVIGSFCKLGLCIFDPRVIYPFCSILGIHKVLFSPITASQKCLNSLLLLFLNMGASEWGKTWKDLVIDFLRLGPLTHSGNSHWHFIRSTKSTHDLWGFWGSKFSRTGSRCASQCTLSFILPTCP